MPKSYKDLVEAFSLLDDDYKLEKIETELVRLLDALNSVNGKEIIPDYSENSYCRIFSYIMAIQEANCGLIEKVMDK